MILNPKRLGELPLDARSREIVEKTIAFFEAKGKKRLKQDDFDRVWYSDFLRFVKEERIFADLLTPPELGGPDARWDTFRNCYVNEVLGFYGLCYWYTWQVSILGLGPLWMSPNETARRRAADALANGGIFAFGLSEKEHGADIYSTSTTLAPRGDAFVANGAKYYIGNGNEAATVSVFGKMAGSDEYVFFAADPKRPGYRLVRNVVASQSYVAELALEEYPVAADELLLRGPEAWDASLNTVNVGKYNLGWASIGICEHAFHEAIGHAAGRKLYGMSVTDFPHVARMFVDAWARLVAMKVFAFRASDYLRAATLEDRRYLLYNPLVKMKVTTEGEKVIDLLWDVIAAKGFEKDMVFEMAARDIRALPKLEGTVHVNIALIVKFLASWLFRPASLPEVGRRAEPAHDAFLFAQGPARGLGKIRFHDWAPAFERYARIPNVALFREQLGAFRELVASAAPTEEQSKDVDLLLAVGDLFALAVYAHLVLEGAEHHSLSDDVLDQAFDVFVRDFTSYALKLHERSGATERQAAMALRLVRRPAFDAGRFERIWKNEVLSLRDTYRMSE
ncbi:MAG: acyl-CoA dehydrogenase [Thermoanaerobaculia bacterium]|jgi:acyl-CoA dehydrogenase|nr:acyl-CoA dehydrogenase [Thermoanaerobaculia bacterium]